MKIIIKQKRKNKTVKMFGFHSENHFEIEQTTYYNEIVHYTYIHSMYKIYQFLVGKFSGISGKPNGYTTRSAFARVLMSIHF